MRLYYDLHIHSLLSPCGDNDMTPNNIVNMAKLNELDIIAITDHNSCKNCAAAIKVGNEVGITVVPGMELTTSEDIHVVCLFPDLES
ncbi:MAG: PHP domain-containing protein, partial [Clostridia bacterium]|nr:PHP domain-containing protein [Clostridia bacterium]